MNWDNYQYVVAYYYNVQNKKEGRKKFFLFNGWLWSSKLHKYGKAYTESQEKGRNFILGYEGTESEV